MGQILAGALGGLGFSIVFGVRKKYMVLIALNAGLSWAVYLAVNALAGDFAGNMASAMFCSLMAAVLARRIKVPTVVLQMPATVPMIPGGSLYYTMLYVFSGDMINAKLYFLSTIRAYVPHQILGFYSLFDVVLSSPQMEYQNNTNIHLNHIIRSPP